MEESNKTKKQEMKVRREARVWKEAKWTYKKMKARRPIITLLSKYNNDKDNMVLFYKKREKWQLNSINNKKKGLELSIN